LEVIALIRRLYDLFTRRYVVVTYSKAISKTFKIDSRSIAYTFKEIYQSLLKTRPVYPEKVLNWHLVRNILPGIALYQALSKCGETDTIPKLESFYRELYKNTIRAYRVLGSLPHYYDLLRKLAVRSMRKTYPQSGWRTVWVENSSEQIAFDLYTCFYKDVLQQYQCEVILKCFCQIDDDIYKNMSPDVEWGRTTTLGRCGEKCNFKFIKKNRTKR
jgi:hypothetical protein